MKKWPTGFRGRQRSGFTLIELLVVIAIILILATLMMPAIAGIKRRARFAQGKTEVQAIAAGWLRYLSDYRSPPRLPGYDTMVTAQKLETDGIGLKGPFAFILTGVNDPFENNPNKIRYIENYKNVDPDGSPVSPYWRKGEPLDEQLHRYYIKFDMTLDDRIQPDTPPRPPKNDVQQKVIVWTYNLDAEPGDEDYIIRSWQ